MCSATKCVSNASFHQNFVTMTMTRLPRRRWNKFDVRYV